MPPCCPQPWRTPAGQATLPCLSRDTLGDGEESPGAQSQPQRAPASTPVAMVVPGDSMCPGSALTRDCPPPKGLCPPSAHIDLPCILSVHCRGAACKMGQGSDLRPLPGLEACGTQGLRAPGPWGACTHLKATRAAVVSSGVWPHTMGSPFSLDPSAWWGPCAIPVRGHPGTLGMVEWRWRSNKYTKWADSVMRSLPQPSHSVGPAVLQPQAPSGHVAFHLLLALASSWTIATPGIHNAGNKQRNAQVACTQLGYSFSWRVGNCS